MKRRRAIVLLLLGLGLAIPANGYAQSSLPPDAEKAFQRGVIAAQQAQWTTALRYFEEARKAAPEQPQILFNLGLAESKLPGRELRASAWLRAYLAANPGASNAKAVRELIDALDVRLEGTIENILRQTRDLAVKIPEKYDRNSALRKVGEKQAAMGDVQAAKETAAKIAPEAPTDIGGVAVAIAEAGNVAAARQILEGMSSQDQFHIFRSASYTSIAVLQARRGDLVGAEATLADVQRPVERIGTRLNIARIIFEAGRKVEAAALVARAKDEIAARPETERANYYDQLGVAQASIDDAAGALEMASLIQKPEERAQVIAAVDEFYRRRLDERLAAGDIAEARRLANAITSPDRRSNAYFVMYKNRFAARDWDESLRALGEVADSHEDKARSYANLADALVSAGDVPRARTVLAQASARLGKMQAQPELVSAYIAAGDLEGAKRVMSFLKDKQNGLLRYAIAQVKAGDLAGAKETIAGMQKDGQRDRALTMVADEEIAAGNVKAAEQTLAMVTDPQSVSHDRVAQGLLAAGDIDGALKHVAAMTDVTWRSFGYADIAREQVERGHVEAAQATMALIPDRARADSVLTSIAFRQAGLGDVRGAVSTVDRMTDEGTRRFTYSLIALVQVTSGDRRGAESTLMREKMLVERLTDPKEQSSAYQSLISYAISWGFPAFARQAATAAKRAAVSVADPLQRTSALTQLAGYERSLMAWTDSRQSLRLAMESALSIPPGSSRKDALAGIVGAQVNGGDLAGARETAAYIADEKDRDEALSWLWTETPDNIAALRVVLGEVKTKDVRDRLASRLAVVLAQRGDRSAAAQLAATISMDSYYRPSAFAVLAMAHVKAGDMAAAKGAMAQIRDGTLSSADGFVMLTISGKAEWVSSLDLFAALVAAGEATWAEQSLRLLGENLRNEGRLRIATARAARGDIAPAVGLLARTGKLSDKAKLCQGMAEAGEVRAATDCAAQLQTLTMRVPVMLKLVEARAARGDLSGAQVILTRLRAERPRAEALIKIASAQVAAGDEQGARETLLLVLPQDAEFEPWATHVIAMAQPDSKLSQGITLARGITDPFWRDRALLALLPRVSDATTLEALLGAITEPLLRSQERLAAARRELNKGNAAAALKHVQQIAEVEARAMALFVVASSGLPGTRGASTVQPAASLPNGAAKAYLCLALARAGVAAGDSGEALQFLHMAEIAARSMDESIWKALAFAEVSQIAARAGNTTVADTAMQLARGTGDRLPDPERARWLAFLARPPAEQMAKESRVAIEGQWTRFIESNLKDPPFTDLAGHLQSITAQAKSKDMVDGLVATANTLLSASKEMKAKEQKP